jgi:hypothetical protein
VARSLIEERFVGTMLAAANALQSFSAKGRLIAYLTPIEPSLFLYFQHVALAGHHLVKHWIHEEAEEQARYQAGHNHNCKRLLRI